MVLSKAEKRRQSIIDTTGELYFEKIYNDLTLDDIIERLEITRPTFYKYFTNKETVLLFVLVDKVLEWFDEFQQAFQLNVVYTPEKVAELFSKTLINHSRMFELYQISFSILEQKASHDQLVAYKRAFLNLTNQITEFLVQLFPKATLTAIGQTLVILWTSISGVYTITHLSDWQNDVMAEVGAKNNLAMDYQQLVLEIAQPAFAKLDQ